MKSGHSATRRAVLVLAVLLAAGIGCDDEGVGGLLGSRGVVVEPTNGSYFWYGQGSPVVIRWIGITDSPVYIELSTDGGNTWMMIVSGVANPPNSYAWTIPTYFYSSDCMFRVVGLNTGEEAYSATFELW